MPVDAYCACYAHWVRILIPYLLIPHPDALLSGSAMKVELWDPIPEEDINPNNGQLYDSPHPATRERINLADCPLTDDDGAEIRVYSAEGLRLRRRTPLCDPDEKPCALLVNLKGIHTFFEDPSVADYNTAFDDDSAPQLCVNAYRQCGFKSVGHIQVNRVPVRMTELIGRMNTALADNVPRAEGADDDMDGPPIVERAITGVDCQFYNAAMHRVRGTADTHDAQRGDITAAFAGSFSQGPAQKRTAARLRDACNVRLPHTNFNHLINHEDLDTTLRAEFVFNIDIKKLKPSKRGAG